MFENAGQTWRRWLLLVVVVAVAGAGRVVISASEGVAEVRAQKGDGVYSLLRRHGLDPDASFKEFLRLNDGRLGKDHMLIEGRLYRLPARRTVVHEPLFGELLERVEPTGEDLAGAVFYLISGHGGADPGGIVRAGAHR